MTDITNGKRKRTAFASTLILDARNAENGIATALTGEIKKSFALILDPSREEKSAMDLGRNRHTQSREINKNELSDP